MEVPSDPRKLQAQDKQTLQNYGRPYTDQGKIFSRKRSGNTAKHQRQVKLAIKHARFMALLPYVGQ